MVAPSHLKSFQALEAALRAGSLKDAADGLAITPAAVGQRIKSLEDYLGLDLLVRGRSGLAPTASLVPALAHIHAAFRELEAASELLDLQRGQEIHIAAVPDFADLWLRSRLVQFRAEHPNTLFRVNGEGEAPLRLRTADCEISFGARTPDGTHTDILFGDYVAPIATPENVQRIKALPKRERLEGFPLLHFDFYKDDPESPNWPIWVREQKYRRTAPERGLRFQRIASGLDAVLAHAGIAICGLALIRELVDSGELALPFGIPAGGATEYVFKARFRAEALARPQVRRFRAWLQSEASDTAAWLSAKTARRAR
ncbi:MAG: LysR substrate-binding domain-containing protein [Caulobacterales bacterium]